MLSLSVKLLKRGGHSDVNKHGVRNTNRNSRYNLSGGREKKRGRSLSGGSFECEGTHSPRHATYCLKPGAVSLVFGIKVDAAGAVIAVILVVRSGVSVRAVIADKARQANAHD